MTVQLTIIGLGQIGASVGLSLAGNEREITRFGHDLKPDIARQAQKIGAVDKIFFNLPAAVENAEIVLLALPVNQVRETMQVIAPFLQENVVVMDTAPVKGDAAEWLKELLPEKRHYVGLTPAVNPRYLQETERGIQSAHADLFNKGLMAVAAPAGTEGAAIKLAADLATLLGATPLFMDLAEVDSMMAALQLLPQLAAVAIAHTNLDQPGWKDARKLAGNAFFHATSPILASEADALIDSSLLTRENILRTLDEYIGNLEGLRGDISNMDKANLETWVEKAVQGRNGWWRERSTGDWQARDMEYVGLAKESLWKRLFGDLGRLFGPPKPDQKKK